LTYTWLCRMVGLGYTGRKL